MMIIFTQSTKQIVKVKLIFGNANKQGAKLNINTLDELNS